MLLASCVATAVGCSKNPDGSSAAISATYDPSGASTTGTIPGETGDTDGGTTEDGAISAGETNGSTSAPGGTGGAGSSSGPDDGSSTGSGVAPQVMSTYPAQGMQGVARDSVIRVTFDQPMDPTSIDTNGGATTCTGTIQASADGFTSCLAFDIQVVATSNDAVFEVTPTNVMDSVGNYQIRVTTSARSVLDVPLGEEFETASPFVARYGHTITIDGVNDFDIAGEALAASSPSTTGYVAWDETYLYLGLDAPDISSSNQHLFWFAYLGGGGGTSSGVTYQTQSPTLPFSAPWHARWKADGSYSNMQGYAGLWDDALGSWLGASDVARSGTFVEMRLPRTGLGDPATLPLVMGLVREEPNNEATYAGVPAAALNDGYDPDLSAHYDFDIEGSELPADHLVQ